MVSFICGFAIFTYLEAFSDIHGFPHTSLVLILAGDKKSLLTVSVLDQLIVSSVEDGGNAVVNCVGGLVCFPYRYIVGPRTIKWFST